MHGAAWLLAAALASPGLAAPAGPAGSTACRLDGVEHGAWCGSVRRPLDPAQPQGAAIDVHYALLPAVARNKKPDPVFFIAGGPGQSAIDLAGAAAGLLARFGNRRDIVLVDQRGTGRSAPLVCTDADADLLRPLAETADPARQAAAIRSCRVRLQALPHGDLRRYVTWIASGDIDAVRRRLGAARIDLVGVSYGSRVALDVLRQFPGTVRRAVLDGVAPPDMALPQAAAVDARAAFELLLSACGGDAACRARYPDLRAQWQALRTSLPREVGVRHPVTLVDEKLTLTTDILDGLLRSPLYVPALASALPYAIAEAAAGRFTPLIGLATAFGGGRGARVADGMHYAVLCGEDWPRMDAAAVAAAPLYAQVCADWPRGAVPAAFYTVPPSPVAVLLLSGGIDPATPPRHAARVARALGAKARAVTVANAGHGLLSFSCLRDAVFRFVDADDDAAALAIDTGCAAAVPRPPAWAPPEAAR